MKQILFLGLAALALSAHAKLKLEMGALHGCYIDNQNKLFCFGSNAEGQLGDGTLNNSTKPVEIKSVGEVVSVDMHGSVGGDNNTCVATKAGKVFCWGSNTYGTLGQDPDTVTSSKTPVQVQGIEGAQAISLGYWHACALLAGNKVKCWGANGYNQLGQFAEQKTFKPVEVAGLPAGITSLISGHSHNCVIAAQKLYCWGANNVGQIGQGTKSDENIVKPTLVNIPGKVLVADMFGDTACAGTENGAYCWGDTDNLPDILGQGMELKKVQGEEEAINEALYKPHPVRGLTGKIDDIVIRRANACALTAGKIICWGANTSPNAYSWDEPKSKCLPETVATIPGFTGVSIASDNYELCAVQADDKVNCWGVVDMCNGRKLLPTVKLKRLF